MFLVLMLIVIPLVLLNAIAGLGGGVDRYDGLPPRLRQEMFEKEFHRFRKKEESKWN